MNLECEVAEASSVNNYEQNGKFLTDTFRRALAPSVISILGGNLNILADGVIVGQKLGSFGLSAISICIPLYLVACIFGSWVVSGTAIQSARALGAGSQRDGDRYCHQSLALSLSISLLLTLVGFAFLNPIVRLLCPEVALQPLVHAYAWTSILGMLPRIVIYIPFWYLRLDGKNRSITVMMLMMGSINIVLDLIFMYVWDMGIFGAGIASVIATTIAAAFGFYQLFGRRKNFTLGIEWPQSRVEAQAMIYVGSPSAMNNMFQTCRILMVNTMLMNMGGSNLVAVFTALNGVAAFAECILSGVPQAASAMLGSLSGDKDYSSIRLIVREQLLSGAKLSGIFSLVIVLGSNLISSAYGLDVPFLVPMICLALSLLPGLFCTVVSGYYNTMGFNLWANAIVFGRVFFFAALSLIGLTYSTLTVWLFIPLGELGAALVWLIYCYFRFYKNEDYTFLLHMPKHNEAKQISYSVVGDSKEICSLSENMPDFCDESGVDMKKSMRISLATEELLVLISQENENKELFCDLRVMVLSEEVTLTLRYSGIDYNPLVMSKEEGDEYMGMRMLEKMVRKSEYQNISGMNVLRIIV